ncbi:MAG: flagellar hook-length control protein FliK, partial [Vagococcus sp.]
SQKPEMSEQADNKRVIEPSLVMSKEGNRSVDSENKNIIDQKNNSSFETNVKEETVSESLKPVIKVDIKSEEPTFSQLVQPEMNDKTVQTTVEPKQNQVNSTTTKEITVFQKDNITEMTSMIKKEAEFITDGKTHQFKLSLQPQNLGEVDIMLDMKDGKLTAKFLVETEKVKDLIKISLPILQETLAKQNIVVEKPSVSLNTFSESNSFQFSGGLDQRQHQQSKFSKSGKLSQQYQVNDNYEESKSIQTLDSVDILV